MDENHLDDDIKVVKHIDLNKEDVLKEVADPDTDPDALEFLYSLTWGGVRSMVVNDNGEVRWQYCVFDEVRLVSGEGLLCFRWRGWVDDVIGRKTMALLISFSKTCRKKPTINRRLQKSTSGSFISILERLVRKQANNLQSTGKSCKSDEDILSDEEIMLMGDISFSDTDEEQPQDVNAPDVDVGSLSTRRK
ncbi:hypothetical protein Tco_0954825 [Tanacetum coccineum]|uniref:Uncharacterized protein n=1 Tax=Tanacetum coccineum TaxID=301880 RepID=A0ABQ5E5G4_9ASTR